MIRSICPRSDISEVCANPELVIGFHDIVGVELEDPIEITVLIPRANRSGLRRPHLEVGRIVTDGGSFADLSDHHIHSLLCNLLRLETVRVSL